MDELETAQRLSADDQTEIAYSIEGAGPALVLTNGVARG
jgi:hypothetical protein